MTVLSADCQFDGQTKRAAIVKRVLVIGPGGAGKSTLARRLGQVLSLEVIHLDRFYWKPGWIEPAKVDWQATVEELLGRDAWVMDGNYSGTFERRLESCDTVIFLDFPRTICLWRVVKRAAAYFRRTRPDMADGCPEQLTFQFLLWIWNYPKRSRPKILKALSEIGHRKRVVSFQSSSDVESFLARLQFDDPLVEEGAQVRAPQRGQLAERNSP